MTATSEPWPLVGRDDELVVLDQVLDELRGGRILEISGEPGIGKTRMLAELAARARARGLRVLSGRATEFEHEVPFGLFAEALDDELAGLGQAEVDRMVGDHAAALGEVRPVVGGMPVNRPVIAAERYHLHRAIRALLDALAAGSGLVLVLDDTHWADPATVEALVHLVRHPSRNRLLIALATRTGRQQPALAAALATADRGLLVALPLGPLTVQAVATLVGSAAGSQRCRDMHERSRGNPFYLRALESAGPRAATPATWRAALAAEIDALSPTRRLVAHAAAVAGDQFPAELVAQISGLDLPDTLEALDDLIVRDLLRAVDHGRLQFRHPLVRNATYGAAGAGWRRAAHARAAAALRGRAPDPVIAHHVAESAGAGDEQAVETLLGAATATASSSPLDAAHWLDVALRLLPAHADQRHVLQLRRARALFFGGAATQCRDLLLELLAHWPPDATDTRLDAITLCAAAHRYLGEHTEALQLLRLELEALPEQADLAVAALIVELTACELTQLIDPDWRLLERATETAVRHHDDALHAMTLSLRTYGFARSGAMTQAAALLDTAVDIIDGTSDAELVRRPDALVWLIAACGTQARAGEVLRFTDRGMAFGNSYALPRMLLVRARGFAFVGPVDQTLAACDDALDAVLLTPSTTLHLAAYATKAWGAAFGGEWAVARDAARAAFAVAGSRTSLWGAYALGALIELAHHRQHLDEFATQILRDPHHFDDHEVDLLGAVVPYSLARLELLRGNLDRALVMAERMEETGKAGLPVNEALALLIRSDVLRMKGRPGAPAECAQRAAEILDRCGFPPFAANAYLTAGHAHAADGDRTSAITAFEGARRRAMTAGSTWYEAQAIRELRRLGRRPATRTRAAAASEPLTAREREVATLVAKGYPNHRIAEELVVSVRTVTTHVSHILTKLDVPSRAGVATALAGHRSPV